MKRETAENVAAILNRLEPRNINDLIEGKEIKPSNDKISKNSRNDYDQEYKRSSRDRKGDDDLDRHRKRDHKRRRQDYSDDESEHDHQSRRKRGDEDGYRKMEDREERSRRRSRSPRERRRDKDYDRVISRRELPLDPVIGEVYSGRVTNIVEYGCFVEIRGLAKRCDGLVHITELRQERVNNVEDVVSRGQEVKVKVIGGGEKIKLSLKGINQTTGEDLNPQGASTKESNYRNPDRPSNYNMHNTQPLEKKMKKRMSTPERWDLQQMRKSQCYKNVQEFDEFEENEEIDIDEEVINIEMTDHKPPFLRKKWSEDATDMDPVSVIQNPDGSLASAARAQIAFLKERKDMKKEEEKNRDNGSVSRFGRRLDDPMSRNSTQPSTNTKQIEPPEWRKSLLSGSVGKKEKRSILEQRQSLPIFQLKNELLMAIAENQVLVVVGQTGSGKSTQITQFLAEAGYSQRGKIGCTQPRRVAAISVAKRVAEEYGCVLGKDVGYAIRFEDRTDKSTVIKYMTDGILLKECLTDPYLKEYSVIMLDEAHERTVGTDVLFGLLKKAIEKRPDLKLIVTSATLDKCKFSEYFFGCPAFDIPGKTFDVDVYYTSEPETDYIQSVVINVLYLHVNEGDGDILVFLTGQEEIDTACESLYNKVKSYNQENLIILPIYSALPSEIQSRVFEPTPPGFRKVVIATNIAETSLTIDGIVYVIDPGFVKQKVYDSKTDVDQLVVTPISQAQANQRKGRAGRTRKGKCYRLYTEQAFRTEMAENCIPEILRTDLTTTVLTMKAMGIDKILEFDFMDRPSTVGLQLALKNLYDLGALDEQGLLTPLGRKMAEFPLEPRLSKALIMSSELKCSEEILTIVSMLSVDNVFYRPKDKEDEADKKRMRFTQTEGDHFTLLALYNAWIKNGRASHWCRENFIQQRTMDHANDIRKQLHGMMIKYDLSLESCGNNVVKAQKAILSGFFQNVAKKDGKEGYRRMKDFQETFIHPSSCLMKSQPRYVIYNGLQLTTKEYMRQVMAIDPNWLIELAPNTFTHSDPSKLSKAQKELKLEPMNLRPGEEWRISRIASKKTFTKTTF